MDIRSLIHTGIPSEPTEMESTDYFKLLDLLTDVLHGILSMLSTETIISIRRACKPLQAITFDRFADEHFAHIYCWIFAPDGFERLKDILQKAPRLVARIRQVTLTDSYLEDRSIHDVNIVRNDNQKEVWAKFWAAHYYLGGEWDKYKSGLILMHRVLIDLQRLPQDIFITLDLTNHDYGSELHTRSCHSTFFSLITSRTKIDSLAVDNNSFEGMEDIFAHDRAGFMESLSAIRTLKSFIHNWQSNVSENEQPLFTEILRSAVNLQHLSFNIVVDFHEEVSLTRRCPLLAVPSEVLLAGNYTKLQSLRLIHVRISEHDLCHMLRQCQSSLTHLTLRRILLTSGDAGWRLVLEAMFKAPKLVYAQLQLIEAWHDPSGRTPFACTDPDGEDHPGGTIQGRDDIMWASEQFSRLDANHFERSD